MRHFISSLRLRDIPFIAALLTVLLSMPLMIIDARAQSEPAPVITSGPSVAESSITEDQATVSWQTNVESTSVVYFGTTTAFGQTYRDITISPDEPEDDTHSTIHRLTLYELAKDTTYYYMVRSANRTGASVESATLTFKTKDEVVVEPAPEPTPAPEPEPSPTPNQEPETKPEPAPEPKPAPVSLPERTDETRSAAIIELQDSLEALDTTTTNLAIAAPSDEAQALSAGDLCVQNGILPTRCHAWLEARFSDKTCAERGITTAETCEKFLTAGNDGVFPGCEGKSASECQATKNLTLVGYLSSKTRAQADAVIKTLIDGAEIVDLPGLLPLAGDDLEGTAWWRSTAAASAETSGGVLVADADGDMLTDDFERLRGTDLTKKDSDEDGVDDTTEFKNGTNPTGKGRLAVKLTPAERLFVFRKPLEQPRGAGVVNTDFGVEVAIGAPKTGVIKGRCTPNALCILYVYSYIPMVLMTKADADGNFTYALDQSLIDGEHTVYVAITDETGRIKTKSNPLSFFIKEAQAVTKEEFIVGDVNVSEMPVAAASRNYLWASLLLIPIGATLAWYATRKRKSA